MKICFSCFIHGQLSLKNDHNSFVRWQLHLFIVLWVFRQNRYHPHGIGIALFENIIQSHIQDLFRKHIRIFLQPEFPISQFSIYVHCIFFSAESPDLFCGPLEQTIMPSLHCFELRSVPSHYLNQCWVIVNWTIKIKLQ